MREVYVAAIAAFHTTIEECSVGKHTLLTSFRPRPRLMPVWDLSLGLRPLSSPPFEQLYASELKVLSFKTALLLTLACGLRVGDMQALSVDGACMEFGTNDWPAANWMVECF